MLLFDGAGLGLFRVVGTIKPLDHGLGPVAAATLGVTTAVGGGVLRDVIARETPALVRADSELYALPAVAGALSVAIAWELDAHDGSLYSPSPRGREPDLVRWRASREGGPEDEPTSL